MTFLEVTLIKYQMIIGLVCLIVGEIMYQFTKKYYKNDINNIIVFVIPMVLVFFIKYFIVMPIMYFNGFSFDFLFVYGFFYLIAFIPFLLESAPFWVIGQLIVIIKQRWSK